MKKKKIIFIISSLLVLITLTAFFLSYFYKKNPVYKSTIINDVVFACPDNLKIRATFYKDKVIIDYRNKNIELPQSLSASGARYEKDNLVFWNKGDMAFVQENGITTIDNCVVEK
jgi:membrane-bound inhibitor of C-type lysozyme